MEQETIASLLLLQQQQVQQQQQLMQQTHGVIQDPTLGVAARGGSWLAQPQQQPLSFTASVATTALSAGVPNLASQFGNSTNVFPYTPTSMVHTIQPNLGAALNGAGWPLSEQELYPHEIRPTAQQLEELKRRSRQRVKDIIRLSVPQEEKTAYLEALETAPELIKKESDPMMFVRKCDYDLLAAAKMLCAYWKARKAVFEERAFLPMDLSGRGAMAEEDILNLQAGFPALLPRTQKGKQAMFIDRRQSMPESILRRSFSDSHRAKSATQTSGSASGNSAGPQQSEEETAKLRKRRARCPFYVCHLMAQEEQAQTEGVIFLILLALPRLQDYNRPAMKRAFGGLVKAFPMKVQIHLVVCPPMNGYAAHSHNKRYILQELVTSFIGNLLDQGVASTDIEIHFEREKGQVLDELLELGLTKEGIPEIFGGSWTFHKFSTWCQQRIHMDMQRSSCHLTLSNDHRKQAASTSSTARGGSTTTATEPNSRPEAAFAASASTESGAKMLAATASTKRKRIGNASAIVGTAAAPAASTEEKEDEAEQARIKQQQRRNAKNIIHSRQKRARRRQELEALVQQKERLHSDNQSLKTETERLERFWETAQLLVTPGALQNDGDKKLPAGV